MPVFDLFRKLGGRAPSGPVSWIIAGLGNPGEKYENSRHNAGFRAIDILAQNEGARIDRLRFRAVTGDALISGERALLIKPQTFMNNSGESLREALAFYKLPPERLIVIFDDISLPCGRLRVRPKGSDGGHNGIKSILFHLKSDNFPRGKIGVGSPPRADYDLADWVLGSIDQASRKAYDEALQKAGLACADIIKNGAEAAMALYNQK